MFGSLLTSQHSGEAGDRCLVAVLGVIWLGTGPKLARKITAKYFLLMRSMRKRKRDLQRDAGNIFNQETDYCAGRIWGCRTILKVGDPAAGDSR